ERGLSDSHQIGESGISFFHRLGQRDIADSFGGGFAGSGVPVRERRQLALHGDNAQSAVENSGALRIYHLIPIGYGKGNVVTPPRRPLDEIVHFENYDMNKFRSEDQLAGFVKTSTLQGAYGRKSGARGDLRN